MSDPAPGVSRRGPADDKLSSGAVLRTLLGKWANHVDLKAPGRRPPGEPRQPGKVRQHASRRAVTGAVAQGEGEARAPRTAAQLLDWDTDHGGPAL